eukprot:2235602-Rhodomonas_salina.1
MTAGEERGMRCGETSCVSEDAAESGGGARSGSTAVNKSVVTSGHVCKKNLVDGVDGRMQRHAVWGIYRDSLPSRYEW